MTPIGLIELLVYPDRAAKRVGRSLAELNALRRRGAGPRWRRYMGTALYSTADLDAWRNLHSEPRWVTSDA